MVVITSEPGSSMASFFVLWLVFVLHVSWASEAPCNLESSLRERTLLVGRGLLNKLGMATPPPPPASRNVSQERTADFRAVQALGTMRQKEDKPPCFNLNPFSTRNYATFPIRAISLPYLYSFQSNHHIILILTLSIILLYRL